MVSDEGDSAFVDSTFGSIVGTAAGGACRAVADRASNMDQALYSWPWLPLEDPPRPAMNRLWTGIVVHLHLVLPVIRAMALDVSLFQGVPYTS
jgi:hypothetical protein